MRFYMFWIGCLLSVAATAQTDSLQVDSGIDTRYLEDQFYLGVTYNWLVSKPEEIKQHSFSRSIFGGYQRDIPLNKNRNIGLAKKEVLAYYMTLSPFKTSISERIITNSMHWSFP